VERLIHWLREASDRAWALNEAVLAPHGLTLSQGRVLGHLADEALAGRPVLQKDLEPALGRVTSSVTSLLQGLEAKGLVRRIESPTDGRAKELHLTDAGWKLRDVLRLTTDWKDVLAAWLTNEEIDQATLVLRRMGTPVEG